MSGNKCGEGASGATTGIAFAPGGGRFSAASNGALFFADYTHSCIYAMRTPAGGNPDPARREVPNPVDLEFGPTGDLFYVDLFGGRVQQISPNVGKQAPVVSIQADTQDPAPLPKAVSFASAGTSDPDNSPGALRYSWDLDGDGSFGDATSSSPTFTYTQSQNVSVRLKVTDGDGLSSTSAPLVIRAGNTPPSVQITSPDPATLRWEANQQVSFSGTATDADEGALPTSAMDWNLELQHCPSNCHPHPLQGFTGLGGTFTAPDHEYPSYLTLTLTAKDARGATATQSIRLDPRTVTLALVTDPPGLTLSLNGQALTAPAQSTVIAGSLNTVTATDQGSYRFTSWSDDGTASHQVSPMQDSSLTARFEATTPPPAPPPAATQTTGSSSAARAAPATPAAPARGAPAPDDDVVTKQTPPRGSGAVPLLGDDRSPPRLALKGGSRQPALRTGVVRSTVAVRVSRARCARRRRSERRVRSRRDARRRRPPWPRAGPARSSCGCPPRC